jgi:hypothetical protein
MTIVRVRTIVWARVIRTMGSVMSVTSAVGLPVRYVAGLFEEDGMEGVLTKKIERKTAAVSGSEEFEISL